MQGKPTHSLYCYLLLEQLICYRFTTLHYTKQVLYQYTNSGSMTTNGICITVTVLVPPKAQMFFVVMQHVTHNQLSPTSVDIDPVIVIVVISSRHLGYNKLDSFQFI